MGHQIRYCDRCAQLVSPGDLESGRGIVTDDLVLCVSCAQRLTAAERASPREPVVPAGATPVGASRPRARPRPDSPARGAQAKTFAIAVVVAALVTVPVALLALRGRGSPAATNRAHRAPVAQPPVPAPPVTKPHVSTPTPPAAPATATGQDTPAGAAPPVVRPPDESRERALEALALARREAAALAGKDDFDGALHLLKALPPETTQLVPEELKTATDEIVASARKRVGAIEADVVNRVAAADFESARALLADLAKLKTAGALPEVKGLVEKLKSKIAAAAAAKKLAEERAAILAEFDRLMTSGEYAGASDYARSKAAAGGQDAGILRGGERLAKAMAEEPEARIRGARTLIGRKVRLELASGHRTAIVRGVTDSGLTGATTYTINNRTRERPLDLKWSALHADQMAELARLGGLKLSPADEAIMAAYAALASDDLEAAGRAADAAGDHPLGLHLAAVVRTRVKQLAYESAMKRARAFVEKKELKDAALECEKALEAMPDDEKASALLAEVRRLLEAPKTLTLDLGNGVTMEFVYVKPGTFVMGGESTTEGRFHAVETPKHTVTITKGFYLGKYEVTQAQYQVVMGKNPSKSTRDPDCPVDNVPWHDAKEFCKRVAEKTGRKVRLPTEAEWEYACRAGTDTDWSHGGDPAKLTEYAWTADNSGGRSHPVAQKKPNPWGLYDIHGNVCERVADMYDRDYYASSPKEDPTGADVGFAAGGRGTSILRGGTWKEGPDGCLSGKRLRGGGYGFYDNWGFRAAMTAPVEGGTEAPTAPTPSRKLAGATPAITYNAGHAEAMVELMRQ